MLRRRSNLALARGIQEGNLNCKNRTLHDDNLEFIEQLAADGGWLPPNPPFEFHPYVDQFPLEDFEKYIIGTFPPISYLLDKPQISAAGIVTLQQPIGVGGNPITRPWIPFYHGNQGSMWDYLLTPVEYAALNLTVGGDPAKAFLIDFLKDNSLNYADIIKSTQRELENGAYTANDKNLHNICINTDLICHILLNTKAKYLLFNTGSPFSTSGLKIHRNANPNGLSGQVNVNSVTAFDLFVRGCQELGLEIYFRMSNGLTPIFDWTEISVLNALFLQGQMHNKVVFEMRIVSNTNKGILPCNGFTGYRDFTIITGPSPAKLAVLGLANNANCQHWIRNNSGKRAQDFIRFIYQSFRGTDLDISNLYALNV